MRSIRTRPRKARRRGARLAGVGTTVLLVIVSALAFFTVVIPLVLGAQSYTVLTGSMRPALEPGHLIGVRATPIDGIRIGDIVTYQLESGKPTVATHRVVAVGNDGAGERLLITQGDANNVADAAPVREVQLRGVVVYAIPWLGYLNVWATPAVKSVVVTVVGIGAIAWGLIVLLRPSHRRRRVARASAAVAVVGALAAASILPAASAQAAEGPVLLLSTDGITWTTSDSILLFPGTSRIVPGDTLRSELWVQNTTTDPAQVSISSSWQPHDPDHDPDIALAAALEPLSADFSAEPLSPGASARIPIETSLPIVAGNDTRRGQVDLLITVTLTQDGTTEQPDIDPMPPTGAELPTAAIVVAIVLLLAGLTFFLLRRRRDHSDE